MPIDLSPLNNHHDLLFEIPLKVKQGHRFQPTGFPDLGAAEFETPHGRALLVESAQSMANRLEAVCWDEGANDLIEPLRGLSYVRVLREKSYLTSSVTDSHRLNSPYILESKDKTFLGVLQRELETLERGPINRRILARKLLKYDAGSLVHGVFLAKEQLAGGRLRVARALTAFIEADGVKVAPSGGSKQDHVDPTGQAFNQGGSQKGFGHVPFPRDEYTAERITLYVSIDLAQIRGYGLDETETRLLILLSLFKLRAFLDSPMRLRTACWFELNNGTDIASKNVPNFKLPTRDELIGTKNNGKWSGDLPSQIQELSCQNSEEETKTDKMRVTEVTFAI
ncbi:MAG: type I-U CRISPR-associated RAMP protein Csb1/Cas7u [Bryobacteraceae bacterium]|nr:type I-U CRISPR-associated RAMP protein Csb1/Cas7u [Bryobacteraceae bacterium]MDW8380195.1 type I-U CRISPR-associated RAMP protein Csb1/Cas7u [Bryobacterales bacterium]